MEVVSFTLQPVYLQEKEPNIHWRGGWVGHGVSPEAVVKTKIFCLCRE